MHAAQLRRHLERIRAGGAELIAIGTGDARYARAFIDQEKVTFPVLLDEDGAAAEAASIRTGTTMQLVGPRSILVAAKGYATGHFQHKIGRRPKQLGATFVLGPGEVIRYEHLDGDVADHAPIEEVLAVLAQQAPDTSP
jgi:peroxiredoxin